MIKFRPLLQASAVTLFASAPAAFADVTAQDVWAQWKAYLAESGQTVATGSEAMSGKTLTITDLTISNSAPEGGMKAVLPTLTFTENGDGTVAIGIPPEYPLSLTVNSPDEPTSTVNFTVASTVLVMTASGTPDNTMYEFSGDEVSIALDSLEGPDAEKTEAAGALTLSGLTGKYGLVSGTPMEIDAALDIAKAVLDVDANAKDGTGGAKIKLEVNNIASASDGAAPSAAAYTDLSALLGAGLNMKGHVTYGGSSLSIDGSDQGSDFTLNAAVSDGSVEFALAPEGIHYGVNNSNIDVKIKGSDIPVPEVALTMAQQVFAITMPIQKAAEPQPAALELRLMDLGVGEDVWGLFDPGAVLPHDPATIALDLAGAMNWLVDISAPDAQQQMAGNIPFELHSFDIKELHLAAVGADVQGAGAFTFDNSDLTTWGGFPAPKGAIDLTLVGINGLIGKLVQMGLLPQDQAMMAQMSLGMFTKPGTADDTLTSKIELTPDGGILANGQRLR